MGNAREFFKMDDVLSSLKDAQTDISRPDLTLVLQASEEVSLIFQQ